MSPTPIPIPLFVPSYGNIPNVTPFTFRDGLSYEQRFIRLVKYINTNIVAYVSENYSNLSDEFVTAVNNLIEQFNTIVGDLEGKSVEEAIDDLETFVNAQIALIIDNSVEVQDAVIAAAIGDDATSTYTALKDFLGDPDVKETHDTVVAGLVTDTDSATGDAIPDNIATHLPTHTGLISALLEFLTQGAGHSALDNKYLYFVNVKDFGATGDGITDDTDAIQEAIDTGAKVIFFPAGFYNVSTLHITISDQMLMGTNWATSRIVRNVADTRDGPRYPLPEYDMDSVDGRAVIEVEAIGFKLSNIAVKAKTVSGEWPSHSGGLHDGAIRLQTATREFMGETYRERSLDAEFDNVYISGFYYHCFIYGQGFTIRDSLVTLGATGFIIDFPKKWCIGTSVFHNDDGTADMRHYRIENVRTQANSGALVTNEGPFAEKIMSLTISGIRSDVGGEIFRGNLSRSTIRDFVNDQSAQSPVIYLTSGDNVGFTIEDFRILGLGVSDQEISANYPTVGIHATSKLVNGSINNGKFINIGRLGILFDAEVVDCTLDELYFENCGHASTASRGAIRFGVGGNRVWLNNIYLNATDYAATPTTINLGSGMDPETTGNIFYANNVKRVGNQDSREGGIGLTFAAGAVLNDTKSEPPVSGTWRRGDRVYNANAAVGQPQGWVCTTAGTPGTWTALPNL